MFDPWVGKCSWLENSIDRGGWWATVCRVTKYGTRLKRLRTHTHTHTHTRLSSLTQPKVGLSILSTVYSEEYNEIKTFLIITNFNELCYCIVIL